MRCSWALPLFALAIPVAALAQAPSAIDQSRVHHKNAVVHFNLDEWKEAAAEFKEAYRLHPDPLFLYNIGQCYRKLGDHAEALSYYRKYLRAAPKASNRAEVERRMEELEAALAAASKSREAPPPTVIPPEPSPSTAPAPYPSLTPPPPAPSSLAPPAPAASVVAEPPPPEPAPIYKRWWFWAGVGAAVAAGVTIGVLASQPHTRDGYTGNIPPGRVSVP